MRGRFAFWVLKSVLIWALSPLGFSCGMQGILHLLMTSEPRSRLVRQCEFWSRTHRSLMGNFSLTCTGSRHSGSDKAKIRPAR